MRLDLITELKVENVTERGQPNQERVVISVHEFVNPGSYGLVLGIAQSNGIATPIRDNFYWFGEGLLNPGDWIFLYTGPGEFRSVDLPGSNNKMYSLHWGRTETLLGAPEIVPILFRMDAVDIPVETENPLNPSLQKT